MIALARRPRSASAPASAPASSDALEIPSANGTLTSRHSSPSTAAARSSISVIVLAGP
ncbi:hypothetical protein [Nonomuraea sp. NPDC050643]|uniref:hypothetical protein n=1 Tax=Nonomuraea sp. NPDC050643 TaxID=3155660 RepID=UPI0033CC884F